MDGSINMHMDGPISRMKNTKLVSFINLIASVRSGLEMALLPLECHPTRNPLPQSLHRYPEKASSPTLPPMNGLLTSEKILSSINSVSEVPSNAISCLSMKVIVGHQRVRG